MTRTKAPKGAIKYLLATGSTAISILERNGACTIDVGVEIDPDALAVFWLPEANAIAVSRQARREAGKRADAARAMKALHRAAADLNVTLTPHEVAMRRAAAAGARLDAAMDDLRVTGKLKLFNQHYRAARAAAAAHGSGFMSYAAALDRLRMTLMPYLINDQPIKDYTDLFAELFGPESTESPLKVGR